MADRQSTSSAPKEHPPVRREPDGRLSPGQSLNPGGRPKGLAARVRAATKDGEEIIKVYLGVLVGEIRATARDRLEAGRWLADRGHGRMPEVSLTGELGAEDTQAAADMSLDELRALATASRAGIVSIVPDADPSDDSAAA